MTRGVFLAFEGIDASGKSTQARRVATSRNALFTFEPGDTALGVQLRTWLLDATTDMNAPTESLLMLADRAHHVHTVIEPALAAGRHVVTDRFVASTLAYQGYGRGVDLEALHRASNLSTGSLVPDLTVLLDVPVDVAAQRRPPRSSDRFESAGAAFHDAVRQGFLSLARDGGDRWIVVDATNALDDVAAAIDERLDALDWGDRG